MCKCACTVLPLDYRYTCTRKCLQNYDSPCSELSSLLPSLSSCFLDCAGSFSDAGFTSSSSGIAGFFGLRVYAAWGQMGNGRGYVVSVTSTAGLISCPA